MRISDWSSDVCSSDLGYAPSYYGWYGDYYYPGTGVYVYDRYRRPHRWSSSQQRYWSRRGEHYRRENRDWRGDQKGNWGGWNRGDHDRGDRNWNRGDHDRGDRNWNRGGRGSPGRWHGRAPGAETPRTRSEEHTAELQSLMRLP